MMRQRLKNAVLLPVAAGFFWGASLPAQVVVPPGTFPHSTPATQTPPAPPAGPSKPSAGTQMQPSSTTQAAGGSSALPSLLDQPAQPAQIAFSEGKLAVTANNASLLGILHQISKDTGMKVTGSSADQRIFGTYGPGATREVLLSLLEGSGYNVVMVGSTQQGAPLKLELSTRGDLPAPSAQPAITQASSDDEDGGDDSSAVPPPQPAALPNANLPEPGGAQAPSNSVKTPQQLLQELQQMHQQQQQQAPQ